MKPFRKIAAAVLILALLLSGCSGSPDTLTILIPKIGKADCSILKQGSSTLMIDCGEAENADTILSTLKQNGITKLDTLIITHFDKDHVGGAARILRALPVGQVLEPDYTPEDPESDSYTSYRQALAETAVPVTALQNSLDLTLGTATLTVTGDHGTLYTKNIDNNHSLLVTVSHAGNKLLFAGDIEKQRIRDVLEEGVENCDFLKVPHHGVYNSALPELFEALGMQYAVITCSNKNPADPETLEALDALGVKTYQTVNGTIKVTSSNRGIRISQ